MTFEKSQPKDSDKFENCQPKPARCGCGGETVVRDYSRFGGAFILVECERCGMQTDFYNTEFEAITAWNKAMGERTAKATRKPEAFFYRCECGYGLCCEKNDMNFCPNCGGRLEWE